MMLEMIMWKEIVSKFCHKKLQRGSKMTFNLRRGRKIFGSFLFFLTGGVKVEIFLTSFTYNPSIIDVENCINFQTNLKNFIKCDIT